MADVDLLLASITSKQLSEWVAFYSLEPFGNEWLQIGTLAATIANTQRDPKKRPNPYKADDFIPKPEKKTKTGSQLLAMAEMINAAFGGKDDRIK